MKAKLKFDPKSIQEFCIRHVEKFVFGAAVLALGYLVYSSMGRDQIDLTPEQLIQTANDADRMIAVVVPKPTRQATLYSDVAKKIRQDIDERGFDLPEELDKPVMPQPHVRPPLPALTVEEVRAAAGHGAARSVVVARGGENRGTAGIRWAVITGLIPLQKEYNEATDAYREAQPAFDPVRDIPQLGWYQVERAEIGPNADLDHLIWKPVSVKGMNAYYTDKFTGQGREVVSENYMYQSRTIALALPPPPMDEGYVWGEELAHVPQIPRMVLRDDERSGPYTRVRPNHRMTVAPTSEGPDATKPAGEGPDVPDVPPDGTGTDRPPAAGVRMDVAPTGGPMPAPAAPGGPIVGGPMNGPKYPRGVPGEGLDREQSSPYKLFRFFDFTVEPGKQYRYRVQLWWSNPNVGIPRQYLANADDSKETWVKTDWSLPTEPVTVPRDSRVLAGEVNAKHLEKCKVGIAYFDMASGSEAFESLDVERGQWLNFYGKTLHPSHSGGYAGPPPPGLNGPRAASDAPGTPRGHTHPKPAPAPPTHVTFVGPGGPAPGAEATETKVDYLTDTLLLDVAGGAKIPGRDNKLTEPGHLLLLDAQGNFVVLHELTDEDEIKNLSGTANNQAHSEGILESSGSHGGTKPKKPKTGKSKDSSGLDALMGQGSSKKPSKKSKTSGP